MKDTDWKVLKGAYIFFFKKHKIKVNKQLLKLHYQ